MHVACLCGANGVGKSALLDAITWALWGRARGQRQEQLVHHGQQEMSVALEFAVGETRYCVTRRYSRARRTPQSSLELTVQAGADYRPVTGNTIAETQAEIIRRISMDYDTFVNSAFLVQGRADQFSMATPMERKVVLSRVLGLEMYERLEARAKLRGRELQGKLTALDFQIERLRLRVADGDSVRESLDKAREEARQPRSRQRRWASGSRSSCATWSTSSAVERRRTDSRNGLHGYRRGSPRRARRPSSWSAA